MRKYFFASALVLLVTQVVLLGKPGIRPQTALHELSGTAGGSVTFIPYGPGFYDINALGVFAGEIKGLGSSNVVTFHRPTEMMTIEDGHFWIVAANGDKLTGVYAGTVEWGAEPDELVLTADWVIAGGTGRFANASGTIHATALVTVLGFDVFEWPATWSLEGTISY